MKKFKLEIITPEKSFYEGEINSLTVSTPDGSIGILANHRPVAIGLIPSIIKFKNDEGEVIAVNGEGFIEVTAEKTTVLCQDVQWPHEIELNKINKEIAEHERKLKEAESRVEYKRSQAALTRLFAALKAVDKR